MSSAVSILQKAQEVESLRGAEEALSAALAERDQANANVSAVQHDQRKAVEELNRLREQAKVAAPSDDLVAVSRELEEAARRVDDLEDARRAAALRASNAEYAIDLARRNRTFYSQETNGAKGAVRVFRERIEELERERLHLLEQADNIANVRIPSLRAQLQEAVDRLARVSGEPVAVGD